jgi:hypothetical protein
VEPLQTAPTCEGGGKAGQGSWGRAAAGHRLWGGPGAELLVCLHSMRVQQSPSCSLTVGEPVLFVKALAKRVINRK